MSRSGVGKTGELGVKGAGMGIGENGGDMLGVRREGNGGNPGEKGVD